MADDGPETPDWIVTFTDLMSLLLTFFILLLTFSTPRVERLFELRGSIQGSFGVFGPHQNERDSMTPPRPTRMGREQRNPYAPSNPPRFRPLDDHQASHTIMRLKDQTGEAVDWERIEEGYRLRIKEAVAFPPGEEHMDSESFAHLGKVAEALRFAPYPLIVVAYVGRDELSLLAREDRDVMDLAIRRAVNIATRLVEEHGLSPDNIAVAGYPPPSDEHGPGRAEFIMADPRHFSGGR